MTTKNILKIEEAIMFAACIYIFPKLGLSWWWFWGCLLLPDIGMVGYLINNKAGAFLYNVFHHKGIAIIIGSIGISLFNIPLIFTGLIFFAHSSMDRMLGYGLKQEQGFKFTHLGEIGGSVNK